MCHSADGFEVQLLLQLVCFVGQPDFVVEVWTKLGWM